MYELEFEFYFVEVYFEFCKKGGEFSRNKCWLFFNLCVNVCCEFIEYFYRCVCYFGYKFISDKDRCIGNFYI